MSELVSRCRCPIEPPTHRPLATTRYHSGREMVRRMQRAADLYRKLVRMSDEDRPRPRRGTSAARG